MTDTLKEIENLKASYISNPNEDKYREILKCIKEAPIDVLRNELGGTKIHSLTNQKGGCSKTTTASDIAYVLAQRGFKVLCEDLDSQASLSQLCQVFPETFSVDDEPIFGMQDLFEYYIECKNAGVEPSWEIIQKAIIKPKWKKYVLTTINGVPGKKVEKYDFGFDLIPTDINLADYEQLLPRERDWNGLMILNEINNIIKKNTDYDFIIIDSPPALTNLAYTAMASAVDGILVPVSLEVMALRGTANIATAVANLQELMHTSNPDYLHKGILGLIKTQYVKTQTVQKNLENVVKEFSPLKAFETSIPRMVACDKAHGEGKLFSQYDKKAFAVFSDLSDEIIAKDILRKDEKELVVIDTIGERVKKTIYQKDGDQ